MIDGLQKCKGHFVVVDYKTNDKVSYAKGVLEDVLLDEGMIVVKSQEKTWYLKIDSIMVLRIDE
jgi:hypothetical protein